MSLGLGELLMILVIAFVVVGPQDLPKIARMAAKGARQAKELYLTVKDSVKLDEELEEVKETAAAADPLPSGLKEELAGINREIDRLKSVKL